MGIRENPKTLVYQCLNCLVQFIEPSYKDVEKYYRETYRNEHDCVIGKKLTPEERYKLVRPSMNEPAYRFQKFVPKGSSVLEVGCSSGYFLEALQRYGYDVYGAELNPEDAAYVRDVGGIPCEEGNLDDIYPGRKFTAVAALAVLEHQPDPIEFLRQIKRKLIGGGYLYLELPSNQDALLTIYDCPEYRDRYYRECHITYWQVETMAKVLGVLGFEASVTTRQRYGLLNHINWMLNHEPTESYFIATDHLTMVKPSHPMFATVTRMTNKLDREYRLSLETIKAGDTIVATCRLRYI